MVSASKYAVAIVDFSQYGRGEGAGVTVLEWPHVASASAKVARICSVLALRLGPSVSSVKLSLYGFHRRKHEKLLIDFVKMAPRRDLQIVALPNPDVDKLLYVFEKHEVKVAVFDTPSGREGDYVNKAKGVGLEVVTGKTHLMSYSDIAAYYAALLSEFWINPTEDVKKELFRVEKALKKLRVVVV